METLDKIKTKNIWYVLGKVDNKSKYGFSNAEREYLYYEKLENAIKQKELLEEIRNERIYILERTCEVIL